MLDLQSDRSGFRFHWVPFWLFDLSGSWRPSRTTARCWAVRSCWRKTCCVWRMQIKSIGSNTAMRTDCVTASSLDMETTRRCSSAAWERWHVSPGLRSRPELNKHVEFHQVLDTQAEDWQGLEILTLNSESESGSFHTKGIQPICWPNVSTLAFLESLFTSEPSRRWEVSWTGHRTDN